MNEYLLANQDKIVTESEILEQYMLEVEDQLDTVDEFDDVLNIVAMSISHYAIFFEKRYVHFLAN